MRMRSGRSSRTCYDPEIPVNIVDLGLIYSMEIKPQTDGGNLIEVKMTLTAPGCGMGPSIASDAQRKILSVPGVTDAQVDVVWDPPWSADRISPEGKAKLGDDLRLAVTVLNTPSARESGRSGNKTSTSSYGNSSGFGTEFFCPGLLSGKGYTRKQVLVKVAMVVGFWLVIFLLAL